MQTNPTLINKRNTNSKLFHTWEKLSVRYRCPPRTEQRVWQTAGNVRSEWKTRPHPRTSHDYVSLSPSARLGPSCLSTPPLSFPPIFFFFLFLTTTYSWRRRPWGRDLLPPSSSSSSSCSETNPEAHWFLAHRISKTMRDSFSSSSSSSSLPSLARLWGCLLTHHTTFLEMLVIQHRAI